MDENGIFSQKTIFKGYDQKMVRLNFKNFIDLEEAATFSGKTKLNWEKDVYGARIPHRKQNCLDCDNYRICEDCEIKPKTNCLECEVYISCKICVRKITQTNYCSTQIIISERLPENEFGFMLPHYKRELGS